MCGSSGVIQRTSYLSTEQSDSHCVYKRSSPCLLLLLLFARTWQMLWRRRYCGTRAGRMCQRWMQSLLTLIASPPCTSSGRSWPHLLFPQCLLRDGFPPSSLQCNFSAFHFLSFFFFGGGEVIQPRVSSNMSQGKLCLKYEVLMIRNYGCMFQGVALHHAKVC